MSRIFYARQTANLAGRLFALLLLFFNQRGAANVSRGTQRRPGFLPPANSVGCNSVAALGLLTRTSSGHKVSPKTRLQPPILARALTRANSTSLELVSHHPRFTSLCPRAATVCTAPKRSCSTGTRPAHAQTRCLHNEPAYLDAPSGDRRQGATRGGGAWPGL